MLVTAHWCSSPLHTWCKINRNWRVASRIETHTCLYSDKMNRKLEYNVSMCATFQVRCSRARGAFVETGYQKGKMQIIITRENRMYTYIYTPVVSIKICYGNIEKNFIRTYIIRRCEFHISRLWSIRVKQPIGNSFHPV